MQRAEGLLGRREDVLMARRDLHDHDLPAGVISTAIREPLLIGGPLRRPSLAERSRFAAARCLHADLFDEAVRFEVDVADAVGDLAAAWGLGWLADGAERGVGGGVECGGWGGPTDQRACYECNPDCS